jgi:hypothetical protein
MFSPTKPPTKPKLQELALAALPWAIEHLATILLLHPHLAATPPLSQLLSPPSPPPPTERDLPPPFGGEGAALCPPPSPPPSSSPPPFPPGPAAWRLLEWTSAMTSSIRNAQRTRAGLCIRYAYAMHTLRMRYACATHALHIRYETRRGRAQVCAY